MATRNLACMNCRQWVLRSFIASIGGTSLISTPPQVSRRTFASSAKRYNEARERIQQAEKDDHSLNDISFEFSLGHNSEAKTRNVEAKVVPEPEAETEPALEAKKSTEGHIEEAKSDSPYVPWYLQVESPIAQQESNPLDRQKIPDIPNHSPDLLEPLIQRVSVELGMDDLALLDLRELDPPPALGANLFMIVGTARSEKHLHVSADKLCRWLRSQYHMTPFADGLLGRQELKVKMRRRAKKSKLLSAVGAKSTASTELDEGIRTGWVCVNVGRVEGGELPKTENDLEAEKEIVGFGTRASGSHIVVQLMTEEKRAEIDLEKLWSDLLWRSKKTKEEQLKKAKEEEAAELASPGIEQVGSKVTIDPSMDTTSTNESQIRI
ncbi:ATPase synthesis protein 25, mitochondrial [Pseudocercospora fuligena]|uniref:ATPase synthesis protein 25 n=1 Tax=Pseudocercospora fuligena TaxID=685502 RepID=A0A8H6VCF7_9PEZI|nr:ATPase synthesis protein 25, mitochondrial [Pseudocercospora fuligena]